MKDTNESIRNAVQVALTSQNKTALELAQELGIDHVQFDRLQSGLEGLVPVLLLEVLDVLGLELRVHAKEEEERALSVMLQDNARS